MSRPTTSFVESLESRRLMSAGDWDSVAAAMSDASSDQTGALEMSRDVETSSAPMSHAITRVRGPRIAGEWTGTVRLTGLSGKYPGSMSLLVRTLTAIKGTVRFGDATYTGKNMEVTVSGNSFTFRAKSLQGSIKITGTIDAAGTSMSGKFNCLVFGSRFTGKYSMTRA